MTDPRVLLLHNRYRTVGGEERSVELQARALGRAGVPCALLERRSADAGRVGAAAALLRGGEGEAEVARAVREHRASVVHVHNMLPLLGPRALAAARGAGAKVVLHLHNVRLFCATGFGERFGAPCTRCRGRRTLPGLVLNCRRSLPEAVTYAAALAAHQPAVIEAVARVVAPSEFAAGQVARLGLPRERVEHLNHYLPAGAFAERSRAGEGEYVLVASRLSPEKGIETAIEAAAAAGAPLRVAGAGPDLARLRGVAARAGGAVSFLGRRSPEQVRELLAGAAAVLMPSRYHEFAPYSAIEAMAQGVPVVAMAVGGLPELLGEDRCVPRGDVGAFAARLTTLWSDAGRRAVEGEELLDRARERHGEERYVRDLLALYERL